jgi:transcriptional regulator with XRE-family HTH domain
MSMPTRAVSTLPEIVTSQLLKLGQDLELARKRRGMSKSEFATRMMVNRKTVDRLEQGDPSVSLGIVATAFWVLGLQRRLGEIISPESDEIALQDDLRKLPRYLRSPSKRSKHLDF